VTRSKPSPTRGTSRFSGRARTRRPAHTVPSTRQGGLGAGDSIAHRPVLPHRSRRISRASTGGSNLARFGHRPENALTTCTSPHPLRHGPRTPPSCAPRSRRPGWGPPMNLAHRPEASNNLAVAVVRANSNRRHQVRGGPTLRGNHRDGGREPTFAVPRTGCPQGGIGFTNFGFPPLRPGRLAHPRLAAADRRAAGPLSGGHRRPASFLRKNPQHLGTCPRPGAQGFRGAQAKTRPPRPTAPVFLMESANGRQNPTLATPNWLFGWTPRQNNRARAWRLIED